VLLMPRVRHYTDDAGLQSIRAKGAINLSRGSAAIATGIHVEIEPFRTERPGLGGPIRDMGAKGEEAYVEFDAPAGMVPYVCGPRNTALIPATAPLPLQGLNPVYVRLRRRWYEFWRKKPT
jgi:hypothetical protein